MMWITQAGAKFAARTGGIKEEQRRISANNLVNCGILLLIRDPRSLVPKSDKKVVISSRDQPLFVSDKSETSNVFHLWYGSKSKFWGANNTELGVAGPPLQFPNPYYECKADMLFYVSKI